jgi:hypothetical protein
MRTIRTIKRADDMPLFGMITRVRKGLYEVVIKFVKSHRTLHVEQIGAPDISAAKALFIREFPTLTWGKPKPPKAPKVKQEKARVVKRAAKKVLRKRKKSVRRKVRNPLPNTRRRNPKASAEL